MQSYDPRKIFLGSLLVLDTIIYPLPHLPAAGSTSPTPTTSSRPSPISRPCSPPGSPRERLSRGGIRWTTAPSPTAAPSISARSRSAGRSGRSSPTTHDRSASHGPHSTYHRGRFHQDTNRRIREPDRSIRSSWDRDAADSSSLMASCVLSVSGWSRPSTRSWSGSSSGTAATPHARHPPRRSSPRCCGGS